MPLGTSRRRIWQAGLAGLAMPWRSTAAQSLPFANDDSRRLRVLAWPGYADPDVIQAFERREGARVELTLVGSDDVLRQRMGPAGGQPEFDVLAANTVEIARLRTLGLLAPLPLSEVPGAAAQLPRFQARDRIAGLTEGAQVYALPFTYSEMGLIFDRRQLGVAPDSIAALWDEHLQGRVLAFDGSAHAFSLAAMKLAMPPFQIPERRFPELARQLVDLRRNVRAFYSLPEESVDLFRRHRIALLFANYGRQQLKLLRDQGLDVGYVVPREGALAWLDCWAMTRQARNPDLALRWIDHMLSLPVSRQLTQRQGLANTLEDLPDQAPGRLVWLEPVEDEVRRARLWRRIVAGDLPQRL